MMDIKETRKELIEYSKWLFSRRSESPTDAAIASEIDTYLVHQKLVHDGELSNVIVRFWIDQKGRKIDIMSMSDKWLNNIKKSCSKSKSIPIIAEIKRRKEKRNGR